MKIDLGTLRLGANLRGPMVISLEAGEFLRLEEQDGIEVRCESGRLWITGESRPEDVWLKSGETASLGGPGLTLIEAMDLTRLRIGRAN
jgi:hypothetical protein